MISTYLPAPPIQWTWITLAGPDARDFLHRLTTVNVQALDPGQGAKGFFLTPLGKNRAYFTLWCYRPDEYAFEMDAGETGRWNVELRKAIEFYTFAEKLVVTDVSATGLLESRWLFATEASDFAVLGAGAARPGTTTAIDEEIRLNFHGASDYGRDWVTVWGRPARLDQWLGRTVPTAPVLSFEALERLRIHALRPRVDLELTDATIPLEVGLREGVAENKGCYPGQEVIERIVSLGSPARRLARVDGEGEKPARGEKLYNGASPAAEVGEVTSGVISAPGKFEALAMVRKIHAIEGAEVYVGEKRAHAVLARVAPYV